MRQLLLVLLLALTGCTFTSAASQSEVPAATVARKIPAVPPTAHGWPNLFGPALDSSSSEAGLNLRWDAAGPPVLWRKEIGTGYSAPVAAPSPAGESDLILLHREADREVLACHDALTGDERWRFDWPTTYRCPYEYSSGPYATPVIEGACVYAVGAQGQLHCVDRYTGRLIWERNLRKAFQAQEGLFGYGAGILVDGERLYLNVGDADNGAGVVAFAKTTGETLWQASERGWAYTTPRLTRVGGRELLLVLTDFGLAVLDPATGELRGEFEFHPRGPDVINAVTPVVRDDKVLLVIGPGVGAVCLQLVPVADSPTIEFKELWKERRVLDSQFNNLILLPDATGRDHVYGFTASQQGGATFRCIDFLTGKLRWKLSSELGRGQALAVDGQIILLGEHGHLARTSAQPDRQPTLTITDQPRHAAPCYSQPALCAELLFVRTERQIVCYDLR